MERSRLLPLLHIAMIELITENSKEMSTAEFILVTYANALT